MIKNIYLKLFAFTIILFISIGVFAQSSMSSVDIKTIKVDELTDEQLSMLIEKANEKGVSIEQLPSLAIGQGLPPLEAAKLRTRLALSGSSSGFINTSPIMSNTIPLASGQNADEDFLKILSPRKSPLEYLEKKVFGYDIFNNRKLTFEPNLSMPTPKNYMLGPGDEIIIDIWGASQANYRFTINTEGNVFIPNIGPVQLSGITIEKASDKLIKKLANIYSGISGSKPNTFALVMLGKIRSIKVSVIGDVRLPGTYTVPSLATLFTALYVSGGPSFNGSFRSIDLYRDNKLFITLDVYDFLINGNQQNNITLRDQDIIKINPFKTRVKLYGEIKKPAYYETIEKDNFNDLIKYAGFFTDKAYTNQITVIRNTDKELKVVNVSKNEFANFQFNNGDSIFVETILSRFENRVEIKGAVYRPGQYAINDSLTVKQLIKKAEGLKGDAFLNRATILRTNDDYTTDILSVDLGKVLKNEMEDINLKKDDILKIYSIFDLKEEYNFQIEGEVKSPGTFPFSTNTTLGDIIAMAGGFLESASQAHIEVSRRVKNTDTKLEKLAEIFQFSISKDLKISDSTSKFKLEPFDRVYIRRSPGYQIQQNVYVVGEVTYPGVYSIASKTDYLSDLIKRAGGITKESYIKGATLIRKKNEVKNQRNILLQTINYIPDSLKKSDTLSIDETIGINLDKILKNPHSKVDILLEEGDILQVPKKLQTVRIKGSVLYPVSIHFDKGVGVRGYVSQAGGFAEDAKKSKTYVIYPNGSVKRTHSFLWIRSFPKVEPGCEVVVPAKPAKEPMSAAAWVGIGSAVASTSAIIVSVLISTGVISSK